MTAPAMALPALPATHGSVGKAAIQIVGVLPIWSIITLRPVLIARVRMLPARQPPNGARLPCPADQAQVAAHDPATLVDAQIGAQRP